MEENKQLSDKQTFLKSITSLNDKSRIAELEEMILSDETCKAFVRYIEESGYEKVKDTPIEIYHNKKIFNYKSLDQLHYEFINTANYIQEYLNVIKKDSGNTIEFLRKEFEAHGYVCKANANLYPDGKVYTNEYTEWLEKKVLMFIKKYDNSLSK